MCEVFQQSMNYSTPVRKPKPFSIRAWLDKNKKEAMRRIMGIKGRRVHMIEELSETIISFQRVSPGAKERLVQITGANEDSINTAKHLIEDTIRRNASPVREHGMSVSGPLTGSSSSINSSASEDNIAHSTRNSRALMHSLSTNDANIGEYKFTVVVNNNTLKITGDNLDLVRTSKLVLDEYFSGEPLQDIGLGQFYSFDSLPQPIIAELSPKSQSPSVQEIEHTTSFINGQNDDPTVPRLRKPKTHPDEKPKEKDDKVYSLEFLARLSMSPACLQPPTEWDKIKTDYPNIVRTEGDHFDAKQYLTNRSSVNYSTVLSAVDDADSEV